MSIFKRGRVYYSKIMRNGQMLVRTTKMKNLADARRVEAKWLMEISAAGETIQPLLQQRQKPLTLSLAEDQFFKYLDSHVAKERTRVFYKDSWKPLVYQTSVLSGVRLQNIDTATIETWARERSKAVGISRVNASLRTLRRFMHLAMDWNLIAKMPKIKLLPGEKQREFVISEALLARMLKNEKCTEVLKRMLPFLIDTGLRVGEALKVKWENVDVKGMGAVAITEGKTKYARRRMPLTARAKNILVEMKKNRTPLKTDNGTEPKYSEYVWTNAEGNGFSSSNWPSKQFTRLRNAMKLPKDCVIHSCRHTFCTRLAEAGVSAFELQRLAGHGSIVISQRYTHLHEKSLDQAVAKMEAKGASGNDKHNFAE